MFLEIAEKVYLILFVIYEYKKFIDKIVVFTFQPWVCSSIMYMSSPKVDFQLDSYLAR